MHFSPSATVGLNHITNAVIEMQKFTDAERLKREHIKRSTIPPLTHTHLSNKHVRNALQIPVQRGKMINVSVQLDTYIREQTT
jgi:hypothetical protein